MPEGTLETANGKIWYSVYGESQPKTPILVLHGGPGFMSMRDGLGPFWEDRPVYFYDQLGCGNSDRAVNKDFYSVENYVVELAWVRAGLKLDEVYLMGFSWVVHWPAPICWTTSRAESKESSYALPTFHPRPGTLTNDGISP
jgi:pimeloyl-ACP methyl ester carboxylesterase